MKLNERSWAGHIISWIKESINNGSTISNVFTVVIYIEKARKQESKFQQHD